MGGEIGVDSAPGVGSLFWFEVPLERGDEAGVVAATSAAEPSAWVPPRRVLAADDVELNRDLLGDMLGRHGHEVVFATDGAEAVELASRGGFDLVLMDVQMPVVDGVEATRRIRKLPPPAGRVPIVALTANVMASERERTLAAGMDDCLAKPVDWGLLFAALARYGGEGRGSTGAASSSSDVGRAGAEAGAGRPSAAAGDAQGPPPGHDAPAAEAPLLDRGLLDRLGASLPAEAFAGLVRRGIENAERACARLPTLPAGSEEQVREAHSLKGTAGTFGLTRVGAIAGEVEEAARSGHEVSELVGRLAAAVAATREELRAAKLVLG
jgi:CheY-like chemotaxis protein/HPt (histidine-containing phosphotransfer) domain-containing protein